MNRSIAFSILALAVLALTFVAGNSSAQIETELQPGVELATYEYAIMIVDSSGNENLYQWLQGELNLTPRPVPIDRLASKLEQSGGQKTFSNLLNTIGDKGWELVTVDGSPARYTFKRRTQQGGVEGWSRIFLQRPHSFSYRQRG